MTSTGLLSKRASLVRQAADHLAEGIDFVVAVAAGNQQVGRMPERPRTPFWRAARDCLIELVQKRIAHAHFEKPLTLTTAQAPDPVKILRSELERFRKAGR